jgi:putative SOS response-associated peptidase YedK
MIIPPPRPAPYLQGLPQLPDDLLADIHSRRPLTLEQEERANHLMRYLTKRIWLERKLWEIQNGVEIQVEDAPRF